jgi:peptidoglycan/xylan/chitin deacetylase (PgdA/CDA1 family)
MDAALYIWWASASEWASVIRMAYRAHPRSGRAVLHPQANSVRQTQREEIMSTIASPWPDGCRGAVSLTFDDGLESQRAVAAPLLSRYGLSGTFYVNPQENYMDQLAPWQEAASAGHEIGNHTVSHPCSINFQFIAESGRTPLEQMTMAEIEAEIVTANQRLQNLFPAQQAISFAYPCYQPFIGRGPTRQSYVPAVARQCVAGRGRGERPNDATHCDLFYLWSFACERMSGAELIGLAENAAAQGRWAILTFHGVHEGHLPIGDADLEELCAFLAAQRNRIWTAPLATVAQRVQAWQTHGAPA